MQGDSLCNDPELYILIYISNFLFIGLEVIRPICYQIRIEEITKKDI